MRVVLAMQDEYEKEDKHREEEEWHMLSKDEQVPILHQGPRKLIKIAWQENIEGQERQTETNKQSC